MDNKKCLVVIAGYECHNCTRYEKNLEKQVMDYADSRGDLIYRKFTCANGSQGVSTVVTSWKQNSDGKRTPNATIDMRARLGYPFDNRLKIKGSGDYAYPAFMIYEYDPSTSNKVVANYANTAYILGKRDRLNGISSEITRDPTFSRITQMIVDCLGEPEEDLEDVIVSQPVPKKVAAPSQASSKNSAPQASSSNKNSAFQASSSNKSPNFDDSPTIRVIAKGSNIKKIKRSKEGDFEVMVNPSDIYVNEDGLYLPKGYQLTDGISDEGNRKIRKVK
jgi:hypothetical protein